MVRVGGRVCRKSATDRDGYRERVAEKSAPELATPRLPTSRPITRPSRPPSYSNDRPSGRMQYEKIKSNQRPNQTTSQATKKKQATDRHYKLAPYCRSE
jgi:hypothetical protein